MQDSASLSRLEDIVLPGPVSWWPPAIGWWILASLSIIAAAWFAVRALRQWRANAYRRAALAELHTVQTNAAVAEVIKRTALAAFGREQIASMSGLQWCQWLESRCATPISEEVRRMLTSDVYREPAKEANRELVEFASQWIRTHQHPVATEAG